MLAICPAFDATLVAGLYGSSADRVQITLSVLGWHGGKPWFPRSRLADRCAIRSFALTSRFDALAATAVDQTAAAGAL